MRAILGTRGITMMLKTVCLVMLLCVVSTCLSAQGVWVEGYYQAVGTGVNGHWDAANETPNASPGAEILTIGQIGNSDSQETRRGLAAFQSGAIGVKGTISFGGFCPNGYGFCVGDIITMAPWYGKTYFEQCYIRMNNWGTRNSVYLAKNVGFVHRWGNGWVQDFRGGRYGDGIIMLRNGTSRAYCIWGDQWQMYKGNPMRGTNTSGQNWLGYPISDCYNPSVAESRRINWYGGGQRYAYKGGTVQYFQLGYITYTNGMGAYWTKLR